MKKVLLLVIIIAWGLVVNAQSAKKYYKNAKKLFDIKQYEAAIGELNNAIDINNQFTNAYVFRAQINELTENCQQAAADFEKAASLDPKTVSNYYNAGRNYYKTEQYEQAMQMLTEAVIYDKNHFQALQYKALTHIKLEQYTDALLVIEIALQLNQTYLCYYIKGVANDSLKKYFAAIVDYKQAIELNPDYNKPYIAAIKAYQKINQVNDALELANKTIKKFETLPDAYLARSVIYKTLNDIPNAINDLSKLLTLKTEPENILLTRGQYYFEYGQYQNSRSDFSRIISLNDQHATAYYWRARSSEELLENQFAIADYKRFISIANTQNINNQLVENANNRLYSLQYENNKPIILINVPVIIENNKMIVLKTAKNIEIMGTITDQSPIKSFSINNNTVNLAPDNSFVHPIIIDTLTVIAFKATDVYNNTTLTEYKLVRIERDAPEIKIISPFTGHTGVINVTNNQKQLQLDGIIIDESYITKLFIDENPIPVNTQSFNPQFSANINITNVGFITIKAIDQYNNQTETNIIINRTDQNLSNNNPMGITWAFFIENTDYTNFDKLQGPVNDINELKKAFAQYRFDKIIHKKNLTKEQIDRFFAIELRDSIKANNINNILIWYAGHGNYTNQTGYWIPVDATNDEFTHFNINTLKAHLQNYNNLLNHILIVSDACQSGAAFYLSSRALSSNVNCNSNAVNFKSAQVFASNSNGIANDNSLFAQTFAKALLINNQSCITIDSLAIKVTGVLDNYGNQKPQFGIINGLTHQNGTFVFIRK